MTPLPLLDQLLSYHELLWLVVILLAILVLAPYVRR